MKNTPVLLSIIFSAFFLVGCGSVEKLTSVSDPKNTTYMVNGQSVTLTNGISAQGSTATSLFEANTQADINGDGTNDTIVLLTQNTGGSGTFFYAALALHNKNGDTGSNAVLLGDRIAPQSTRWNNGVIEVNYADRKPNESFTVSPSVGVTKYLKYSNGQLVEIQKP